MNAIHVRPAKSSELALLETMPHALHYEHHLSFIRHALGSKECLVAEIDGTIAGFVVWDRGFYARPFCGCSASIRSTNISASRRV